MAKFEYHPRSTHINPGVTMTDLSPAAQLDIVRFMGDNYLDSPDYRLKKESNPFLQGHDAESGWIFVEFWSDPEKHQTTVDRLLEIFLHHHPDGQVAREELNTLPGNANPGLAEQLKLTAIGAPESESLAKELEEARVAQAYTHPSIWGPLMERVRKCLANVGTAPTDPSRDGTVTDRDIMFLYDCYSDGKVDPGVAGEAIRFNRPHVFPSVESIKPQSTGNADLATALADIATSSTPLQFGEVNQHDFVEERVYFPMKQPEDSPMEKTIEITITGAVGIGKSRITAMIHEMLEREFQNLKIEVSDHDGPKVYSNVKERLAEMKGYPLHPDAVVKISNCIRPQSLTDTIRESTAIATLSIDGVTPVPGDRVYPARLSYGAAANDDPENPA